MNLTPEIVVGVALGAVIVYGGGVLWSHYRQKAEQEKRNRRKEPTVTEDARGIAVPGNMDGLDFIRRSAGDMDHNYKLREDLSVNHPARRHETANSAANRRPSKGAVQSFRAADVAERRRDDEDQRRNGDLSTLAVIAATQPESFRRSEPHCSPSYDDSSSRSSSSYSGSDSCSGSSSSSSSDSGSSSSSSD